MFVLEIQHNYEQIFWSIRRGVGDGGLIVGRVPVGSSLLLWVGGFMQYSDFDEECTVGSLL